MLRRVSAFSLFLVALCTLDSAPEQPAELTLEGKNHPVVLREFDADPGNALALSMLLGRRFVAGDFAKGAPPVAIVSETLWREVFRRQPDAIGRKISLAGAETIVVGIAREQAQKSPARTVWKTRPPTK